MLRTMMMSEGLLLLLFLNCLVPTRTASPDPCQSYSVLNDAWRATNHHHSSSKLHCDTHLNWQGWYRMFLGDTSVQMPETCPEKHMCGTHAPLWLTAPHPLLSDGVQKRGVCGHWSSNCCAFKPPSIDVKACPGNYYVYKFVKPNQGCWLAYCADVNTTVCATCRKDEACVSDDKITWKCEGRGDKRGSPTTASPTTASSTTASPTTSSPTTASPTTSSPTKGKGDKRGVVIPELVCGRSVMQVGLPLAQLEGAGLDGASAHLVDRRCSAPQRGNGTVWYQVQRTEDTCGNILTTNGSHAIYSNTLFVYPNVTVGVNGSLVQPLSIPFSCDYSLETEASLDVAIGPVLTSRDRLSGGLSGSGPKARASMSLFRSDRYTNAYPAGRVTLPLGSVLYVGVSVEEIEKKRFVVVLENCYATHTSDPEDRMRYVLIQRKCPSDRRQVVVSESGSSIKARFSALLFLFQGDYRDVFLHCSLSLCDQQSSSCTPNCSGRSRRSVSESLLLEPLTIGPITWDQSLE